jgi:hypothetical protein
VRKGITVGLVGVLAAAALVPAAQGQEQKTAPGKEFAAAMKGRVIGGVKVTKATCPKTVKNKKKTSFKCTTTFASTDKIAVLVTLTDTNGGFKVKLVDMLMRHLETQLERISKIAAMKGVVACPAKRAIKKNDKFVCNVTKDGQPSGTIEITQQGNGKVAYAYKNADGTPG